MSSILKLVRSGIVFFALSLSMLYLSSTFAAEFTTRYTGNGLGSNFVYSVVVSGSNIYAGTASGLSISRNGGASFTNYPVGWIVDVKVVGTYVYAATHSDGLAISKDGGYSFTNKNMPGLSPGYNYLYSVYASGTTVYVTASRTFKSTNNGDSFSEFMAVPGYTLSASDITIAGSKIYCGTFTYGVFIGCDPRATSTGTGSSHVHRIRVSATTGFVYAATAGGLSISKNGGFTFVNKTTANGLGANEVYGLYVDGSKIYAGTHGGGFSVSTDGGETFTIRKSVAQGLGGDTVHGIYISNGVIYLATSNGLSFGPVPTK
ncbi:hypothetical protein [Beggiatoa leptomitoformis]|uniref:Exo-alpha-sialidase n=1 Tax=Beggiatoa leptomitoformis TaxID=288004 RepID=A0A2N9YCV1_9GAMM|nr:hypothetical protein [Beggiatoa leptomitoformis]ALG66443.1 hypothetical protein AL038_00175 [Beggiatoa leptomitoformis]AUI68277.1 hypothetical protein BLE401_05900 [Beggiatoa leptomitoformis]